MLSFYKPVTAAKVNILQIKYMRNMENSFDEIWFFDLVLFITFRACVHFRLDTPRKLKE